jgi:hypothetical protein
MRLFEMSFVRWDRIVAKRWVVGRGTKTSPAACPLVARIEKCREPRVTNRHFWVVLIGCQPPDATAIPFQSMCWSTLVLWHHVGIQQF